MTKSPASFSGFFFLLFLTSLALLAAPCISSALKRTESPCLADMTHGRWTSQFEKTFGDMLLPEEFSRNAWGRIEYALFRQGRGGVITGTNGWLFTLEEFSCPVHATSNFADNVNFIGKTRDTLAQRGIKLAIVIVPAKARIYQAYLGSAILPACRARIYNDARASIASMGIPVTDLQSRIRADHDRDALYLRTDTHWSPEGARLAASVTGERVRSTYPELSLPSRHFHSKTTGMISRAGDLMRYLPGVPLAPDRIATVTTEEAPVMTADASADLLGDTPAPEVVLVGTSYSANPAWNFAGFLKEALKTDVLNMSDEGEGPFTVMDKYLDNNAHPSATPRLIVWEIPERYLLYPHGTTGKK